MIIKLVNHPVYKYIVFVHPPRTSGTSIEVQLQHGLDFPHKHESTDYYEQILEDSFSFGTIRNPFDILVSKYKIGWYESGKTNSELDEKSSLQDKFLHWLKYFISINGRVHAHEKENSLSEYFKKDLDFYIKYETRHDDLCALNKIFEENNIPINLKSEFIVANSYTANYKDFYNEEAIDLASSFYENDLRRFNYAF